MAVAVEVTDADNMPTRGNGGVIYDHAKEKIDIETAGGFGSLILFDGRAYHGVEDVDLDQVIDFSRADGRLAAFVNLYAVPSSS